MKNIPNQELRVQVLRTGLSYRKIAGRMRVTPEWLSRLLAQPLSQENELRVKLAIGELLANDDRPSS